MAAPIQQQERRRAGMAWGVTVQILLAAVLLGAVNYAGFHYYQRWDHSRTQKYRISDLTERVIRALPEKTTIYVVFSPTSNAPGYELYPDVANLLKEYQMVKRDTLHVEFVDPMRHLTRARELQAKYQFGPDENLLIVDCAGRTKFINAVDLADYDFSGMMTGEPARITAFRGEQALTGALLEVSEPQKRTVYFLQGQGEPPILGETAPLAILRDYITRQGVTVEPLNADHAGAIPEDASVVVIAGAAYDVSPGTRGMLEEYWEKQGRLLVLLDPDATVPNIHALLARAGIRPRDDRILRTVPLGTITGILREVTGVFSAENRVTRRLQGVNALFLGNTQSLEITAAPRQDLAVESMITAAPGFWGETEYLIDNTTGVAFDEATDHAPPLVIAAMAEQGGVTDDNVAVSSSRMVVVGNAEFARDAALTEANLDFLLSALNWMLDQHKLIGVAPKTIREFTLSLTGDQTGRILLYTMIVIPGAAALAGLVVWWRRRR